MCLGGRCVSTAAAVQQEAQRSAVRAVDFMVGTVFWAGGEQRGMEYWICWMVCKRKESKRWKGELCYRDFLSSIKGRREPWGLSLVLLVIGGSVDGEVPRFLVILVVQFQAMTIDTVAGSVSLAIRKVFALRGSKLR